MAQGPIQITLEDEAVVDFVRAKVRSGEYASEADVIRDGIAGLQDKENESERWLHEVGGARHDAFHADPARAVPIDQVERNLAERRLQRIKTAS